MNSYNVTDPDDPVIQDFLSLNNHQKRQERERPDGDMAMSFLAEGDQVIERAIRAGHVLLTLVVDASRKKPLPSWIPKSTTILFCEKPVILAISGRSSIRDPIGSFIRPTPSLFSDEIQFAKTVVVTENVTNPTNMGALFRNASALDADLVCIDTASCDPLYRRSVRVSMGQVFRVNHARMPNFEKGLDELGSSGFLRVGLTPDASAKDISGMELDEDTSVALLVGAEQAGLTTATLKKCDYRFRIPMSKDVDSLNVATAVAIALHATREARRR